MSIDTITITGASDDIVQIKGPGFDDEIDCYETAVTLEATDGTRLTIEYTNDGCWAVTDLTHGTGTTTVEKATDPDGDWPAYTDKVTITGASGLARLDGLGEPLTRWGA